MFDATGGGANSSPRLGLGLTAGAGVAVAGGIGWAIIGRMTGWQIGYIAIALGYGVGLTVVKVGRTSHTLGAASAAALALGGALFGHLAWVYTAVSSEVGVPILDVITAAGPVDVLSNTEITEPFSWAFFLLAAFAGFRAYSSKAAELATAPTSYAPPTVATSFAPIPTSTPATATQAAFWPASDAVPAIPARPAQDAPAWPPPSM